MEKKQEIENEKQHKENSRCFISLEMPFEVKQYIEEVQKLLKKKNLFYGKMTEFENLHLTLKFLGEIDEKKIEEVRERLKKVKLSEFEASLAEAGAFSEKIVRIIWLKMNGKGIFDLQKAVDESLRDIFPLEGRFMSHLTIARVKKAVDKKMLVEYLKNIKIKKMKFKIGSFFLKKSELTPNGPVYEAIEEFKL